MATACIPDTIRPRLGQFVRLLASDQPGEVVAAAAALRRALAGVGADLNDLGDSIAHPPVVPLRQPHQRETRSEQGHNSWSVSHRREVRTTLEYGLAHFSFTLWEVKFIANVIERLRDPGGRLTLRQIEVVNRLIAKVEALC